MSESTSNTLLHRIRTNDKAAWDRFVDLYSPIIFSWCTRMGFDDNDAADIGSEALKQVFRSIGSFEPGSFRGWLRTITRRKAIDKIRQKEKEVPSIGGTSFQQSVAAYPDENNCIIEEDELAVSQETLLIYGRAVQLIQNSFPDHYYAAFVRYAVDGVDAKTVASEFEISRDAVYAIKRRVILKVQSEFAELLEN